MEEDLQNILSLRPLQESVNILRSRSTGLYRRLTKESLKADLNNLLHRPLNLEDIEIKLPDPNRIPPVPEETTDYAEQFDELIMNYEQTVAGMALL